MQFATYQRELSLTLLQNPVEQDLTSLILTLLRDIDTKEQYSFRDVTTRRRTKKENPFYGISGFPDIMVLSTSYRPKSSDRTQIFGAVELKFPKYRGNWEEQTIKQQLSGHLMSFDKVLYTDGLLWQYTDGNHSWECQLGHLEKGVLVWKDEKEWTALCQKLEKIDWAATRKEKSC